MPQLHLQHRPPSLSAPSSCCRRQQLRYSTSRILCFDISARALSTVAASVRINHSLVVSVSNAAPTVYVAAFQLSANQWNVDRYFRCFVSTKHVAVAASVLRQVFATLRNCPHRGAWFVRTTPLLAFALLQAKCMRYERLFCRPFLAFKKFFSQSHDNRAHEVGPCMV